MLAMAVFVLSASCDRPSPKPTPQEMTPIMAGPGEVSTASLENQSPEVRVKFRRNKDNTCSWEIDGDDPDAVLEADRKLISGVAARIPTKTR